MCKSYNTCTSSRCLVTSITRLRKQLLFFPTFNLSALPGDHTPPALRQSARSDQTLPEVPSPGCRDSIQTHQCTCWVQGSPVTETKTMFGTVVCLPPTPSPTASTAMVRSTAMSQSFRLHFHHIFYAAVGCFRPL